MPFLEGLGFGLATVILIGPVFFTLLKAGLEQGVRGGVLVAMGIICSDLLIVLICLSGVARVLQQWIVGPWLAIAAGALLAGLGIRCLIAPQLMPNADASQRRVGHLALFVSGFVVNFLNPFVFAVWLGLVMHAAGRFTAGNGTSFFLAGALAGIFITDLAKALLAPRLKPALSPGTLKRVNAVIGIALLGFGLRAFVHAAQHWD
ncbi:MAG: LysE family transporter [Flavobacteriales bacterium]|nr:LysE family transporter [Flavobacteriales bacterium]